MTTTFPTGIRSAILPLGLATVVSALSALTTIAAESEPNNTRAQANSLTFNSNGQATNTGRISPLSDLDFFSTTTPPFSGQATLLITMTPTSADRGLDARLQLQNSSGTVLADRDVGYDNAPETLTFNQAVGGTTYFIVCRSADLADAGSGDYSLQVDLPKPNLVPYQPPGWSDRIVVSKSAGNSIDGTGLTSTNILYVDWAVVNAGNAATTNRFDTSLFVDGILKTSWFANPPLNTNFPIGIQDYAIGPLSAGTHTLTIIADATGAVSEINETDNEYTKTITVVDDDPNDQISGALALGGVAGTITMPGATDSPTDVDVFSYTAVAGQRLSFDIDQTSGLDSYIRLFSTNGVELAANNDATGPGEVANLDSYLEYTFTNGGTFYLGISGFSNTNYNAMTGAADTAGSTGSYTLIVSPGLAGTMRRTGGTTDLLVDILGFGSNPMAVSTNERTWIVIHGWNSSRTASNIFAVASALYQTRPGDQVLTLDWNAAADTGMFDPFSAESSIVPVAQWAASALSRYGFSGTNLNLVGHSFGSYVADEIAERIPGGVNTIVTLDPAADIVGGYDPTANSEVDFGRDSFFSWSFHSSSAGNEYTPATADEAFIVNSGLATDTAHANVVFLFAYMLTHPNDVISQFFLLTSLLNGRDGPWLPNQYVSSFFLDDPVRGYEAVIDTTNFGKVPSGLTYVRLPSLFISNEGTNVAVVWHASYTNFVLQSTASAGQPASWTNVSIQPTVVGQANVVVLPASGGMRFFRLRSP